MSKAEKSFLVSTEWLEKNLTSPDLKVVDASYFLPHEGRDARREYEDEHIPGAVFFDIDAIKNPDSPLPHMLPAPEIFSAKLRKLGLGDGNRIVVYDRRGMMSAPRVWWTLKAFGAREAMVLDGGLPKWKAEGRPLDDHPVMPMETHFTARLNTLMLRDIEQMTRNLESGREQVVDARAADRFEGRAEEVWPGRRAGHIPGSRNLPFTELCDPKTGALLPRAALRARFEAAGLDLSRPIVTTCGSGVTAAVLSLALAELGKEDVALYDGSWAEWGLPGKTPIATGPAD